MSAAIEALAQRFPRCVYIIRAVESGLVKVGSTTNLPLRLRTLASVRRDALEVLAVMPGGQPQETYIHFKLRNYRVPGEGREWFYDRPEVHAMYAQLPADQRPLGLYQPRSRSPLHPHHGLTDAERTAIRRARYANGTNRGRCVCSVCKSAPRPAPSLGAL